MERGKVITLILALAVFFALLSIVISLSIDNAENESININYENTPSENSANIQLVVEEPSLNENGSGAQNE